MMKTASQIAGEVLEKVAASNDAPPGLASVLSGGTGIGLLAGGLGGTSQSGGDILRAIQLKGVIPQQEAYRKQLQEVLKNVKRQAPELRGLTDRTLVKKLLELKQTPPMHYALQRGYEEGLLGLSRSTKTLKALQRKILKNIAAKSAIGTGVGLGGGLLAATALGHFD